MASFLKPTDSDKDYFDRVKDKTPTFRSICETIMIFEYNHPGWIASGKVYSLVKPLLEVMADHVIGYKPIPMNSKDSKKQMLYSVADSIVDFTFPSTFEMYGIKFLARDMEYLLENCIYQTGVWALDFYDKNPTRKELMDALYASLETREDHLEYDFERIRKEGSIPFNSPEIHEVMLGAIAWLTVQRLCNMLHEARDMALEGYDARKQDAVKRNQDQIAVVEDLKKEGKKKQDQLNKLQLEQDKLKLENTELKQELKDLKRRLAELEKQPLITVLPNEVQEEETYPDGTILVGGQPKWQQQFAKQHPNVKIMDGFNHNINMDAFNETVPLVLFNVTAMAHTVFYRVQPLLKKKGIEIKYLEN